MAILGNGANLASAQSITKDEVFRVWEEREKRVQTAKFSWTEWQTIPKGSYPDFPTAQDGQIGQFTPRENPSEDTTHEVKRALSVDHEMLRVTKDGPDWISQLRTFVQRFYISVNNGEESRIFHGKPSENLPASGAVNRGDLNQEMAINGVLPILITYRASHKSMGRFEKEKCRIAQVNAILQGKSCIVLEQPMQGNYMMVGWIDPASECSILRFAQVFGGRTGFQTDITYVKDAAYGYVPSSWQSIVIDTKTSCVRESDKARVDNYALSIPIDRTEFTFQFPPGTLVQDDRDGRLWAVLEGDKVHHYSEEEMQRGATYEEIVEAERTARSWFKSPIVWLLVLLSFVSAVIVRAYWGKRRNVTPGS